MESLGSIAGVSLIRQLQIPGREDSENAITIGINIGPIGKVCATCHFPARYDEDNGEVVGEDFTVCYGSLDTMS